MDIRRKHRSDCEHVNVIRTSRVLSPDRKVPSMFYGKLFTSSCSRIIHCERNIPLERGSFCLFYEKKKTIGPSLGYLPFQEKIKQKWSEKLKMTFLNHFHQGGHPGARPERVRCIMPSSLALH